METILLKRREIFFQNLILLGFDANEMSAKYAINCNKDMFCLPNKKGFEVVTYFLFSKLNKVGNKEYKLCWPVLDKDLERTFRKSCHVYLTEIAKESKVKFPQILPSLFSSPGGNRFYELYLAFSSHVLEKTIQSLGEVSVLNRPIINRQNFKNAKETLQLSTIHYMNEFKEAQEQSLKHMQVWQKCAKDFVTCYTELKKSISEKTLLLKDKTEELSALYGDAAGTSLNLDEIILQSESLKTKVIDYWKALDDILEEENELWNKVSNEIEENSENLMLNGSKYKISIPSKILQECSIKLEKIGFLGLEKERKLSLLDFLKLWIVCFQFYADHFKQVNIDHAQEICPNENDVLNVSEYLDSLKHLSKILVHEILPEIENNIKGLKELVYTEEDKKEAMFLSEKYGIKTPDMISSQSNLCDILPEPGKLFAVTKAPEKEHNSILYTEEIFRKLNLTELDEKKTNNTTLVNSFKPSLNFDSYLPHKEMNEYFSPLSNNFASHQKHIKSLYEDTAISFCSPIEHVRLSKEFKISDSQKTKFMLSESWLEEESFTSNIKQSSSKDNLPLSESWLDEEDLTSMTLPTLPI